MKELLKQHLMQILQPHLNRWNEFEISIIDLAHYLCFATPFGYYVPNAISSLLKNSKEKNL